MTTETMTRLEAKLAAAEARAAKLEAALREVAARPCEMASGCEEATDVRVLWCSECIARAALAPGADPAPFPNGGTVALTSRVVPDGAPDFTFGRLPREGQE